MDDFTINLAELTDMASCDLKLYDGLERLWRMVERYKMTPPITITVVDNAAGHVRAIRGCRIQRDAWHLEDTPVAATPPLEGEAEFPLTIKVQDAKGNILKMRVQLEVAKPELRKKSIHVDGRQVEYVVSSHCSTRAAVLATGNQIVGINACVTRDRILFLKVRISWAAICTKS